MRGELSPPKAAPSNPVGGEVVAVRAPKPVSVSGRPGIPATEVGRAKFGWLSQLKNWPSTRSVNRSLSANFLVTYKSLQVKSGPRSVLRPRSPNWQSAGLSPPLQAPVLGSTEETKAFGLSHWRVPGWVIPGMGER